MIEALGAWLGVHDLALFVAAGLLLNLTPGADLLYVASHTATGGRRAGLLAALGIGAGCLLHVTLAALGLSALLATSDLAFAVLKWAGAAYLVWMGVGLLRAGPAAQAAAAGAQPARGVFWRGVLTNALNPKVALFFLAFLPQFIEPQAPHRALAFALLGLVFTVNGTLVTLAFAWLGGWARERWAGRAGRWGHWLQRATGVLFVTLGVRLAAGGR